MVFCLFHWIWDGKESSDADICMIFIYLGFAQSESLVYLMQILYLFQHYWINNIFTFSHGTRHSGGGRANWRLQGDFWVIVLKDEHVQFSSVQFSSVQSGVWYSNLNCEYPPDPVKSLYLNLNTFSSTNKNIQILKGRGRRCK